jgi:hypothetical protein
MRLLLSVRVVREDVTWYVAAALFQGLALTLHAHVRRALLASSNDTRPGVGVQCLQYELGPD